VILQLQPDNLPVFMMEPALPVTPLVAKDFEAATDHAASIPTIISPIVVGTTVCFVFVEQPWFFCS